MTIWVENTDMNLTPKEITALQSRLQRELLEGGSKEKVIVLPFGCKVVLDRADHLGAFVRGVA